MDISAEIAAIQAVSEGSELRQPLVGALNKLNSGTLPAVTSSDAGKILKVGANGWEVGNKSDYIPVPTATMQITDNGTYDVTNYASAQVHVSGSGSSTLIPKTITQNGTYDPIDDNADGYSEVTVNVQNGLSGYTPISGIKSNGQSNYIDTGIIPSSDTWIKLLLVTPISNSVDPRFIIGSRISALNNEFGALINGVPSGQGGSIRPVTIRTNSDEAYWSNGVYYDGSLHYIEVNYNSYHKLDNDKKNASSFSINSNLPIYLLNYNENGSPKTTGFDGSIISCVIGDTTNGTVAFLVPVIRNSDDEIGMYDLIRNTFYPNLGSGTLSPVYSIM